jgi:hypothetical protein
MLLPEGTPGVVGDTAGKPGNDCDGDGGTDDAAESGAAGVPFMPGPGVLQGDPPCCAAAGAAPTLGYAEPLVGGGYTVA